MPVNCPSNVDEIKHVGLTAIASDKVKSPRVAESQVSPECRLVQRVELGGGENLRVVIFGEALVMHVKDEVWVAGKIEPSRLRAVGRLESGVFCRPGTSLR